MLKYFVIGNHTRKKAEPQNALGTVPNEKENLKKKSCLLYISVIDIRKDFKPSNNNLDISIFVFIMFFVMKLTDL